MTTLSSSCPSEDELHEWLSRSPRRDDDPLSKHFDTCAACQQLVRLLRDSVVGPPSESSRRPAEAEAERPFFKGQNVGRYVVLERLGAGAMGTVYAAYDPDLDRKVALKILRARGNAAQEARALAKVTHPNVLHVYESGSIDSRLFVAMEFVAARTLAEWCQEPRTIEERLACLLSAARGLDAVHEAGVVHRDFKPQNVLVSREGRVVVSDFGLAILPAAGDDPKGQTLAGTPAYMAPELARGVNDARSDQFSFGVVAYETLYGVRPFHGKTLVELWQAASAPPPRPTRAVPKQVHEVIARALLPDPAQRYPSMSALVEAMETRRRRRARGAFGVVGALALAGLVAWVAARRERQGASACATPDARLRSVWDGAVQERAERAFLATGAPGAGEAWSRVEGQVGPYARRWAAMRTEACEARRDAKSANDEVPVAREACLDERLEELSALRDELSGANAQIVERAALGVESLGALSTCADPVALWPWRRRPSTPAARADIETLQQDLARARVLSETRGADKAVPLLEALAPRVQANPDAFLRYEAHRLTARALLASSADASEVNARAALFDAELSGSPELMARAWALRAEPAYYAGRFKDAEDDLTHASNLVDGIGEHGDARALVELTWAMTLLQQDELDGAQRHLQTVLDLKGSGPLDRMAANATFIASDIAGERGEYELSLRLSKRYVEYIEALRGPGSGQAAIALVATGVALARLHRMPEALRAVASALAVAEDNSPWIVANVFRLAASVRATAGDFPGATSLLDRATRLLDESSRDGGYTWDFRARVALLAGDGRAASDAAARAVQTLSRAGAPTGACRAVLGQALRAGGDRARALATFHEAFDEYEKDTREGRQWALQDELLLFGGYGAALVEAGQAGEALAVLEQGTAAAGAKEEGMAWECALIHESMSRAYQALGRIDEARGHAQRAVELRQLSADDVLEASTSFPLK